MAVVILLSAAVLLTLCERELIAPTLMGTTEVGELSSSEDSSSCLIRLLLRVGLLEHGAGVWGISADMCDSKLNSSANLPTKHKTREIMEILIVEELAVPKQEENRVSSPQTKYGQVIAGKQANINSAVKNT